MGSTSIPWVIAFLVGAIIIAVIISLITLIHTKGKPFTPTLWIVNQRFLGILLVLALLAILSLLAFLIQGFGRIKIGKEKLGAWCRSKKEEPSP